MARTSSISSWQIGKFINHLNPSQREAVLSAAADHAGTVLIQGPPGTGKSTCILSLLRVLLHNKKRVLVTAPTNVAVLDMAKRLIRSIQESVDEFDRKSIVIVANESREKVRSLIDKEISQYLCCCSGINVSQTDH